jgi:hypothetical protein
MFLFLQHYYYSTLIALYGICLYAKFMVKEKETLPLQQFAWLSYFVKTFYMIFMQEKIQHFLHLFDQQNHFFTDYQIPSYNLRV